MKNRRIYINITLLFVLLLVGSCEDFNELEKNPNQATSVPASLVFNGVLNDLNQRPWNDVQRWNQFNCVNYNYYGNNEYSWTGASLSYLTLKNVVKMEEEAIKGGASAVNPYSVLGKFLRAYFFVNMSLRVGDIPMMESLKGTANTTPAYDSQKEIFVQSLTLLDQANTELTSLIAKGDNTLAGDIYLNNDLKKWKKVINTFKLRVLVHLSNKANDADVKVKERFAEILNDPSNFPIMESMSDNLQYTYNAVANKYPVNPDNFGFDATRYNMAATYIGLLTSLQDPRVFYVAEPAAKKVKDGAQPTDFAAFVGASSGEDLADMSSKAGAGEYSFYGRYRYYRTYTAEPTIQIGYPEMCFNIAEGINRGWATGNAEEWYRKGIEASIAFYGIKDGSNAVFFLKDKGKITETGDYNQYTINFVMNDYYNQSSVKYSGNTSAGLTQILQQKYLAFFQNSGQEAYFNYRRTGVPTFLTGPGTGNSTKIPMRFQYPAAERTTNATNYTTAIQQQFGNTNDSINDEMWLIKD